MCRTLFISLYRAIPRALPSWRCGGSLLNVGTRLASKAFHHRCHYHRRLNPESRLNLCADLTGSCCGDRNELRSLRRRPPTRAIARCPSRSAVKFIALSFGGGAGRSSYDVPSAQFNAAPLTHIFGRPRVQAHERARQMSLMNEGCDGLHDGIFNAVETMV